MPDPTRDAPVPGRRCALTGTPLQPHEGLPIDMLRPALAERIRADHPSIGLHDLVGPEVLATYRARYVEELLKAERGELSLVEQQVVESLKTRALASEDVEEAITENRTVGQRLADTVASFGGSWTFILIFFSVLALWMAINVWQGVGRAFDPYPFILLNLVLSCLAAVQAPIIMMSQKRQEAKDRLRSENDYRVNLKAELEIRHLHEKIDHLLTRQWERLAEIQQIQIEMMRDMSVAAGRA